MIIGVQWEQEIPNPRVHHPVGNSFPTAIVAPLVEIFLSPLNPNEELFLCYMEVFLLPGIPDKETEVKQRQGSQTSVDGSLSGLTDSGFTEHYTATSDIATRAGFRPLSMYICVIT